MTGHAEPPEDPSSAAPPTSQLLARRHFLALAGGTAATAALFAACGGHRAHSGASSTSTTAPSTTSSTSTTAPSTTTTERLGTDADLSVLRTLTSVEIVLVTAYDALGAYDVLQTDAIATARLLRDHHRAHAAALQDLTVRAGGHPASSANPTLMTKELDPDLLSLPTASSAQAIRLAERLEQMLAATYAASVGTLTRPSWRKAVMVYGAVVARQATLWASHLSTAAPSWATDALVPLDGHPGRGDAALSTDAYLSAS